VNKLLVIAGWALLLIVPGTAGADTLFTTPVIYVKPHVLNFGVVTNKTTVTNNFLVENIGRNTLVGTAKVPPPFKILSDGHYSLRENEVQIVTIIYTPTGATSDTRTVKFTGGGGATATVTGKPLTPIAKQPSRSAIGHEPPSS
jgi:HYDIN/CFA65/VesB-like, Ig-like domain